MENKNLKEMIDSLEELRGVFFRVSSAWEMCEDMNDTEAIDNYPFKQSFDELAHEVSEWVEETVEELNNIG